MRLFGASVLARKHGQPRSRGRLPGRVRRRARGRGTTAPTMRPRPAAWGGEQVLARHPRPRSSRSTSTTTSGSARPRSRRAAPWPRRSKCSAARALVFERGRRDVVAHRATSATPQGARRRQVQRRLHLPRRRHRLPPRQVRDPRLRPGHRRLGRRPPGPGAEPARPAVEALGVDRATSSRSKLGQMVSLASAAACRSGPANIVDLDELVDDIGPDATRLLSLLTSIDQPPTIDLDVIREQVAGEPRVLRAVRARPHRVDQPRRRRARRRPIAARRRRPRRCSSTSASSTCCARCPSCPTSMLAALAASGRRTRSRRGCASWPTGSTASTTTAT